MHDLLKMIMGILSADDKVERLQRDQYTIGLIGAIPRPTRSVAAGAPDELVHLNRLVAAIRDPLGDLHLVEREIV